MIHHKPHIALPASLLMLAVCAVMFKSQIDSIHWVRDSVLPAAVRIPQLEQRLKHVREQVEVTELEAMLRGGSTEEILRTYALPAENDVERLVQTLEVVSNELQKQHLLTGAATITPGENGDIALEVTGTPEGARSLMLLLELSGLFTVSDALTPADLDTLLTLTEEENPAALPSLENFLGTDLLHYAIEPRAAEEQLKKSFSSEIFLQTLDDILTESQLSEARRILSGPVGRALSDHHLWPMRFLSIESVTEEETPNGTKLSLKLHAHYRDEQ